MAMLNSQRVYIIRVSRRPQPHSVPSQLLVDPWDDHKSFCRSKNIFNICLVCTCNHICIYIYPMDPWPLSEKVRLTLQIITQTLPKKVLGSIGYIYNIYIYIIHNTIRGIAGETLRLRASYRHGDPTWRSWCHVVPMSSNKICWSVPAKRLSC